MVAGRRDSYSPTSMDTLGNFGVHSPTGRSPGTLLSGSRAPRPDRRPTPGDSRTNIGGLLVSRIASASQSS